MNYDYHYDEKRHRLVNRHRQNAMLGNTNARKDENGNAIPKSIRFSPRMLDTVEYLRSIRVHDNVTMMVAAGLWLLEDYHRKLQQKLKDGATLEIHPETVVRRHLPQRQSKIQK